MTLAPGARLDPCEIGEKIGEGGMGDVRKTEDSKLDRFAAIKVLPESISTDPDRLDRTGQDVRHLAMLDHRQVQGTPSPSTGVHP